MRHATLRNTLILIALALLAACSVNPVTGKNELMLVGEGTELQIGAKNFAPTRQSQGGDQQLDPGLTAYVQGVGQRLAAVSDRKLPYEFAVLNNSIPNAWALPGGKISVNRGLLTELKSESELAAVLGHEIVHAAARHSAQAMSRGMLIQGGLIVAQVAAHDSDYGNIAMMGAGLGAQLLTQRYSREAELEADKYGIDYMKRTGYDAQGAVSLQETFVRLNDSKESSWLSGMFASHPPSQERLEANRRKVASFPQGGDAGVDRYRAALARTMRAKPAYDAYDAGRKALSEKHADVALTKAEQAIRLEPDEGHFYALKGDALLVQKKNAAASDAYTAAIQRNDSFFYYYLQRGLVAERQHDDGSARRDLETSLKMLPTGPAFYSLGNIALRARQYDAARQYFASAAGAEGPVGEAATLSLMKLELSGNPEKYLRKQAALDAGGKLVVAIANATKVPVTGLVVSVQYLDAGGQTREFRRELSGTLAGGQQLQVPTGLGPFQNNNQFRIAIVGARVAE